MAEIGGWQDSGGDWHSGAPDGDPWDEADAIRVSYESDGETQWTTILGPFPDFYDFDAFEDWVDEWLDENQYGG